MRPVMLVCLQDHPRAGPFSHRIIVNPDDAAVVTYSDAQQAQPPTRLTHRACLERHVEDYSSDTALPRGGPPRTSGRNQPGLAAPCAPSACAPVQPSSTTTRTPIERHAPRAAMTMPGLFVGWATVTLGCLSRVPVVPQAGCSDHTAA
jgi:hypothetical protein